MSGPEDSAAAVAGRIPRDWDAFYAEERDGAEVWSGRPNGTLVVEVDGLSPGTALEVGCGEGADAVWLATRGWEVTGLDPAAVALERARRAADRAGVDVTWVHAGLAAAADTLGVFDLVSAQYPVLPKDDGAGLTALLGAVAPGGTLLFVHHEIGPEHAERAAEHGFDLDAHVLPHDVVAALADDPAWVVDVDEARERPGPLPEEAEHVRDLVVRARRLR